MGGGQPAAKSSGFGSGFKFGSVQQPQNPRQEEAPFVPMSHFIDTLFELQQKTNPTQGGQKKMNYSFNRQGQQNPRSAAVQAAPSGDYMKKKRTSVFAANQMRSRKEMEDFKPPVFEKTQEECDELVKQLNNSFLTKELSQENVLVIAKSMKKIEVKNEEFIIRYGDVGREYYILKEGTVKVIVY
jgi:hypothetical protein